MAVSFETTLDDFPPNLTNLKIQQVALFFAPSEDRAPEVTVNGFTFLDDNGGAAAGGSGTTLNGLISTRGGNGASLNMMLGKTPSGVWRLALPNTDEMRTRISNDDIQDILFVITFSGTTPAWPT